MIIKSYHKKQAILVAVFSYIVIMGLFFLVSLQNKWEIGQREYYLWSIGAETLGAILTFCIISILGLRKKNRVTVSWFCVRFSNWVAYAGLQHYLL